MKNAGRPRFYRILISLVGFIIQQWGLDADERITANRRSVTGSAPSEPFLELANKLASKGPWVFGLIEGMERRIRVL